MWLGGKGCPAPRLISRAKDTDRHSTLTHSLNPELLRHRQVDLCKCVDNQGSRLHLRRERKKLWKKGESLESFLGAIPLYL